MSLNVKFIYFSEFILVPERLNNSILLLVGNRVCRSCAHVVTISKSTGLVFESAHNEVGCMFIHMHVLYTHEYLRL
jgi:hypothetical protein